MFNPKKGLIPGTVWMTRGNHRYAETPWGGERTVIVGRSGILHMATGQWQGYGLHPDAKVRFKRAQWRLEP